MASDNPPKPDKTPAPTDGPAMRGEIEQALDVAVADFLELYRGKSAVPGWHICFGMGLKFVALGSAQIPTLDASAAGSLVELASANQYAFDAAAYISGIHVCVGHLDDAPEMPPPLRVFAARVLTGELQRPKSRGGRPKIDDVPLRLIQYSLCLFVSYSAPMPLSRNRETPKLSAFSACDAVADAFARAGYHVTPGQLVSLCYDASFADLRELARISGLTDFGWSSEA